MKAFADGVGREWTHEELTKVMTELGVVNRGFLASELPRLFEQELESAFPGFKDLKDPGKIASLVLGDRNILLRMGGKFGRALENNARIALFMDGLGKGMSELEAALRVKKYLFDYSDLTIFERNVLRRVLPFYAWSRFNIPLQFEHLITRPGLYASAVKGRRAVEDDVPPAPDESLLPKWMKDEAPVRIRKNDDGTYSYFLLGGWLPAADLLKAMDMPALAGGLLTPIIKAPWEFFANYSLYFKDNIEKLPYETGTFLGTRMNKRKIGLLRNIRTLNTVDRFFFDKSLPLSHKVGNLLFGRFYPVNFRDEKDFELYSVKRNIRDHKKSLEREKLKIRDDRKKGIRPQPGYGAVPTLELELDQLRKKERLLRKMRVEGPRRRKLGMAKREISPERQAQIEAMARRRRNVGTGAGRPGQ